MRVPFSLWKETLMKLILNAASISTAGTFRYSIISENAAKEWLYDNAEKAQSYVGYKQTAEHLTGLYQDVVHFYDTPLLPRRTLWTCPLNSPNTAMRPGDEALVCKLASSPGNPGLKGHEQAEDWEYGLLTMEAQRKGMAQQDGCWQFGADLDQCAAGARQPRTASASLKKGRLVPGRNVQKETEYMTLEPVQQVTAELKRRGTPAAAVVTICASHPWNQAWDTCSEDVERECFVAALKTKNGEPSARRRRAVQVAAAASEVFWAKVAELVPEAKSGDFSHEDTVAWDKASLKAVSIWIANNVPGKKG
jgi:hypothetical protein